MNNDQKHGNKPNKFLSRLYNMLNESKFSNIISWSETGTSFHISKISEFTLTVLPQYFRHKNFSSFVRQLNMYDFHKERDTGEIQAYSHPCFIRGDNEKLCHIYRKTSDLYSESKPTSVLEKKYNLINSKEKMLREKISMLEQNYQEISNCNQSLLSQIFQYREREQKIEQMLMIFTQQVREVPTFLQSFYKIRPENEIARPIPIPLHRSLNISQ